jgi:hypothetical protein
MDGHPEGETPLKMNELLGGPHRIEVALDGYRTIKRELVIEGEKLNKVNLALVELLPEELALKRLAEWEERSAPYRTRASRLTTASVGLSAFVLAAGVLSIRAGNDMNDAYAAYGAATGSDATEKYANVTKAYRSMISWRGVSAASALAAIWTGYSAHRAWQAVPARPVFEVRTNGAQLGMEGSW